jgi:Family of unknown function (DUF5763)
MEIDKTKCRGTTKRGMRCNANATPNGLCYFHADPKRASELGRLGGRKNKKQFLISDDQEVPAPVTAEDVRMRLSDLIADVMNGRRDPRIATTVAFISQHLLKAIEISALEDRLEQLERNQKDAKTTEED